MWPRFELDNQYYFREVNTLESIILERFYYIITAHNASSTFDTKNNMKTETLMIEDAYNKSMRILKNILLIFDMPITSTFKFHYLILQCLNVFLAT